MFNIFTKNCRENVVGNTDLNNMITKHEPVNTCGIMSLNFKKHKTHKIDHLLVHNTNQNRF